jgi:hypothetical protein
MFSIYLHFCLHYRSKSLKNILKLSPITPFKSVSYKPVKGKQQLEDKEDNIGGVASDLMKTIRWISYESRGMLKEIWQHSA